MSDPSRPPPPLAPHVPSAGAPIAPAPAAAAVPSSWASELSERLQSAWHSSSSGSGEGVWLLGAGVAAVAAVGAGATAYWWRCRQAQLRAEEREARRTRRDETLTAAGAAAAASSAHTQAAASLPSHPHPNPVHRQPFQRAVAVALPPAAASAHAAAAAAASGPSRRRPSAAAAPHDPPHVPPNAHTLFPPKDAPSLPEQKESEARDATHARTQTHGQADAAAASSSRSRLHASSLQVANSDSTSMISTSARRPSPTFALQPSRQSVSLDFNFGDGPIPTRRAMQALSAALLIMLLTILQDPLWLAPISPVILYSLFGVGPERSLTLPEDDDEREGAAAALLPAAARRPWTDRLAILDAPPAQDGGLFGRNIRIRTPARAVSIRGAEAGSGASRGDTAAAAAAATAAAASPSAASSRFVGAGDASAIPFPSLLSPSAASPPGPLGSSGVRAPTATPQQGSSGLILQQPRPTRTVVEHSRLIDALGAEGSAAESSNEAEQANDMPVMSLAAAAVAAAVHPASDEVEHQSESASSTLPSRVALGSSIAASLSRSPMSSPMPARTIDVHAALSRMSPAPQSATKRRKPKPSDESADPTMSAAEASASDAEVASEQERVFFGDSRRAALDALPASTVTASSFRINFTFAFAFEDVVDAFLSLGDRATAERDESDANSDSNTPPITPRKRAGEAQAASHHQYPTSITPTSSSGAAAAHPIQLHEYVVDVVADSQASAAEAAASASSSSSSSASSSSAPSPRFLVRRVHTPLHLPHLLRKLLGDVRELSMDERIHVDMARRVVRLQLASRSLSGFLSLTSTQRITPHPQLDGHTRWSCEVNTYTYSSCGIMRQQVSNFIGGASKHRQHQISLLLSAALKRQMEHRRKSEHAAQQQAHEEDEHPIASSINTNNMSGTHQRIARSSSRAEASSGRLAPRQLSHSLSTNSLPIVRKP